MNEIDGSRRELNDKSIEVILSTLQQTNSVCHAALVKQITALQTEIENGAQLTIGFPNSPQRACERWFGRRLVWWPDGIPAGRRVGLVSSRLGQQLAQRKEWFDGLRTACLRLNHQDDVLLSAPNTTTSRFVERCAELFGLRVLRMKIASGQLEDWVRQLSKSSKNNHESRCDTVYISPPLSDSETQSELDSLEEIIPDRDRIVLAISEQLHVLHVRANGNLHRLLNARLSDRAWPLASVFIARGPNLVPPELCEQMQQDGAVAWLLFESPSARSFSKPTKKRTGQGGVSILSVPPAKEWKYLTHCTRSHNGPWPDEDEDTYLDDLILDRDGADHSSMATLCRILRQQQITASQKAIRGSYRVVSFSAVPLIDLPNLRQYRQHRHRWDFEPYGICISRDWLCDRGSREVVYGDDATWNELAENSRPFFQKRMSRPNTNGDMIDWSVELEWRSMGDVPLAELSANDALVFVRTIKEAQRVAEFSRWPVVSLDQPRDYSL